MVALRRLDAFTKTRPDLHEKSAVGGIITLVAASTAGLLFVGQILLYIMGSTQHSLKLSRSTSIPLMPVERARTNVMIFDQAGRFPLKIHATFPHVACNKLDVTHDGASLSSGELDKVHGAHSLVLRTPTNSEMTQILGKQRTTKNSDGCTVKGTLRPHIVAGVLSITLSRQAWAAATTTLSMGLAMDTNAQMKRTLQQYNISHSVTLEFGKSFSKASHKPLENLKHIIDNELFGIAVAQTQVKLVPTLSEGWLFREKSFQTSVVDITIQPNTLVARGVQQLPGLVVAYDFTPLTVHHSEGRDNFLVFLSSLISIVGGCFVTVGLLTGCLVHSAQAVAKKID